MKKKYILEKLTSLIFYLSIIFFFIAFNFQDTRTGGWYQQWLPGGLGTLIDITFTDSLTGYVIADSTIIKTTNGGDNWFVNQNLHNIIGLNNIQFVNKDSAIISETSSIYKTTNKGLNWTRIVFPGYPYNTMYAFCMYALNFDTIYLGGGNGFGHPQLYLTTNGGINWTLKLEQTSGSEYDKVYFYNKNIGFCCTYNRILKTSNGGDNWVEILTGEGYTDIHFVDSLVGWKAGGYIKKTTNGGLNWFIQPLPTSNWISAMSEISVLNKDTIWGIGGAIQWIPATNHFRGIVYRTTNGGNNWGYQIPDTSIDSYIFINISFSNKNNGWVYDSKDFHTNTGGSDTTLFTNVNNNITSVSKEFVLNQNYPNP
ncbi:MAG: YCF48-related protein, partial [Ignavibacteriae bacterium]|nr:YCF48-related protein [Ignavibacteriota bacterium]